MTEQALPHAGIVLFRALNSASARPERAFSHQTVMIFSKQQAHDTYIISRFSISTIWNAGKCCVNFLKELS